MKKSKSIPIIIILVTIILSTTFAQKPVKDIQDFTSPWRVYSPCGNSGAGEMVSGYLDFHLIHIYKVDKDGFSYSEHMSVIPKGGLLVDEDSGENFKCVGVTTDNWNNIGIYVNFTMTWIYHYLGDMGTNLRVYTKMHLTVNPNGTWTAYVDHSSLDCN